MFCYKGNVMQRRVLLMFALFVVLAGFYASVTRENVSMIQSEQKVQTEMFNQLDEQALSQAKNSTSSSGD
jgi:FlaG/FlaF family flagellin (archaellin)